MSNSAARPALSVNRKLLRSGVVLLFAGSALWLTGAALSATVLAQVAKQWLNQLEESPSEMAQRRLQQLKAAAAAGSNAWREQSHSS